jgi:uncharacterized protein
MLRRVAVVLTTECNLRCGYCYQRRGAARQMSWDVLRAAADLLLAGGAAEPVLACYGGEPLLALPLMKRAAAYLDERAPPGVRPRLAVTTNGTLIDRAALRFLACQRVRLGLSFDGVEQAQGIRGAGTFARLDGLLSRLADEWPGYFNDDVTVTITLSSASLPHLAASVRYFLDRRVPSFSVSPIDTFDAGWSDATFSELDRQLAEASALCRRHVRGTGVAPFQLLRRHEGCSPRAPHSVPMCRIGEGGTVCVDVDGDVTACGAFARSLVASPTGLAAAAFAAVRIGHITDRDLLQRVAARCSVLPGAPLFGGKERKRSRYGACARCKAFGECRVCPVAIANQPGNHDPDAIPPLPCAFHLLAGKHRRRFPVVPRGPLAALTVR